MLENALKNCTLQRKITIKSAISVGVVLLAAFLPLAIHAAFGPAAGGKWLPMYFPVLLGGCVLGALCGALVGAISPAVSYVLSLALLGSAMPSAQNLGFMIAELAVFGAVAGAFGKRIARKPLFAFPAVWAAELSGKAAGSVLRLTATAFGAKTAGAWAVLQTALPGLLLQAVLVPVLVIILAKAVRSERDR